MSVVAQLITGAGVPTTINEGYVPQMIQIGNADTDLPITKLEVSVGGQSIINITGQADIQAFSKLYGKALLGADVKVAQVLVIGNGFTANQKSLVRLTNAGATTPDVMYHSFRKAGNNYMPVFAGQDTINALSNRPFMKFSSLIFDDANLDYADIEFIDGHSDKFTVAELNSRLSTQIACDADGKLAGRTVIFNDGDISQVVLYTTAGGTLTFTIVS